MRIIISLVWCLSCSTVFSQTDTLSDFETRDIVITASRAKQDPFEVGRSVTVLKKSDFDLSLFRSFGELLTRQTGVYTVGAGQTPGALQSLQMRGVGNHQSAILVDGFHLIDPSSVDNALDLSELSLANVERIEIVRGAHGTLYGPSAVGGVVHIITSEPQQTGFRGVAQTNAGIFGKGTHDLSQGLNLRYTLSNGLYAGGDLYHQVVRGLNATIDTVRTPGSFKQIDRDNSTRLNWNVNAGFRNDDWNFAISHRRSTVEADIDDGAFVNDPNYTTDVKRTLTQGSVWKRIGERTSVTASGGLSSFRRSAVDDSSLVSSLGETDHSYYRGIFEGDLAQGDLQVNWAGRALSLVAGGGFNYETMTSRVFVANTQFAYSSLSDLDTLNLSATLLNSYVHADINGALLNEGLLKWNMALGARWNHHDQYGSNWTFELNPSYRATKHTTLYAAWTGGFNAPSLYRLYAPDTYYTSGITRGNKKLKPEKSSTLEAGIKQRFDRLDWSAALYRSVVSNFIDYVYLWDSQIPIASLGTDFLRDDYRGDTYLNVGRQTVHGFETDLNWRPHADLLFSFNAAFAFGRLAYDESKIDEAKTQGHHVQLYSNGVFLTGNAKSKRLVRRPHTANASLMYRLLSEVNVGTSVRYVGRRYDVYYNPALGPFGALDTRPLDPYVIVDMQATYQVSKRVTIMGRVDNVLDNTQQEILGYRSVGRAVYAGVRYAW